MPAWMNTAANLSNEWSIGERAVKELLITIYRMLFLYLSWQTMACRFAMTRHGFFPDRTGKPWWMPCAFIMRRSESMPFKQMKAFIPVDGCWILPGVYIPCDLMQLFQKHRRDFGHLTNTFFRMKRRCAKRSKSGKTHYLSKIERISNCG